MTRFLIFTCLLFSINFTVFSQAKKIALIVAIGDYPKSSGWRKINSVNDVPLIKTALINQGFVKENIVVLMDTDATKVGILKAIDELTKRAGTEDVVYFHFSGHGQQILDDNGDEVDGLDEALVPFDAGMKYELCPAKGKNHLRDDLLGVLLDRIRQKIGPDGDLIVVLDACHSGTATRGIGVSRGTDIIFGVPGQSPVFTNNNHFKQSFYEPTGAKNLSPMVIFSGSSATEQNYEYIIDNVSYGSLSFAFSRVLNQVNPGSTYRSIFSKVQVMMSSMVPRQNPQLEGNPDRKLFAGNAAEQKQFMTVKLWRDTKSIMLDAGQLNGLNVNTIVELHPTGTSDPSQSLALVAGRVVNAQLTEALVVLDQPIEKTVAENAWVFIKEISFGSSVLSIKIDRNLPAFLRTQLDNKFVGSTFIEFVDRNPEILIEVTGDKLPRLIIISENDQILLDKRVDSNEIEMLANESYNQIKLYAQARLLRTLESSNERLRVSFELIPIKVDKNFNEISRFSIEDKKNQFGQIVLNDGDFFKIRITNHGRRTAFYSLLDIQPDNTVNILIPEKDRNGNLFRASSDCKIEAGTTEELRAIFYISKPYGQEVFKLIASNRPLNLDQILVTRGQLTDRAALYPFEALFADSFDLITRSGEHRLPPETIHIHTVVFEIVGGE